MIWSTFNQVSIKQILEKDNLCVWATHLLFGSVANTGMMLFSVTSVILIYMIISSFWLCFLSCCWSALLRKISICNNKDLTHSRGHIVKVARSFVMAPNGFRVIIFSLYLILKFWKSQFIFCITLLIFICEHWTKYLFQDNFRLYVCIRVRGWWTFICMPITWQDVWWE